MLTSTKATHNEVMVILVDSLSELLRYVVRGKATSRYRPELVPIRWTILAHLRARNAAQAVAYMDEYLGIVHARVPVASAKAKVPRVSEAGARRA